MFRTYLFRPATLLFFILPVESVAQSNDVILITVDGLAAYHLFDQSLEIPNLRDLISQGVMAESSETVFPSVTHPSHTTLVTGKLPIEHSVLNNRMRNRVTGETYHVTNKARAESVKVPTLFDVAKKHGLTTAAFFWPETKADPSIDFNIPEVLDVKDRPSLQALDSPFFRDLRQANVPIDPYERYYEDPRLHAVADAALAEAAATSAAPSNSRATASPCTSSSIKVGLTATEPLAPKDTASRVETHLDRSACNLLWYTPRLTHQGLFSERRTGVMIQDRRSLGRIPSREGGSRRLRGGYSGPSPFRRSATA